MRYEIFGPFSIERKSTKQIDVKKLPAFWQMVESQHENLSYAIGCYVFAIGAAGGMKPWYVGQTRRGFKKECFDSPKLLNYNDVLLERSRSNPSMFFLARMTDTRRFTKAPKNPRDNNNLSDIDFLEHYLISAAYRRNPDIRNIKGIRFVSELVVPGIFNNPGRMYESASQLNNTMGL